MSALQYEDDPKVKPGLVCHALCIQDHLQGQKSVYDFLAGDSRYKQSLAEETDTIVELLIRKRKPIFLLEDFVANKILRRAV